MTDRAKSSTAGISLQTILSVFGLVPSFLLFVWVERNMALPWIGTWIGWPWIFVEGGLGWSLAWNLSTIAIFGGVHSGLAGGRVPRGFYVFATGLASVFMLATWQPTGVILYQLIPSALVSSVVSFVLYWTLLGLAFRAITRFEPIWTFAGLAPTHADAGGADPGALSTAGAYGLVRHPAYFLTIAAWFVTPMLGLDRLVFGIGMTIYLVVGIRLEERRLVAKHGEAYLAYRRQVPMLVPRLKKPLLFQAPKPSDGLK